VKVLVIYEPNLPGRLLIERLRQTSLEVSPLLISRPDGVDPAQVGDWLTPDIDFVVNLLTLDDPREAEKQPEQARHLLVDLPGAIATAAAARNIGVLQLSNHYVFDGRKQSAYLASNPACPMGALGKLLWEAEQQLRTELPRHIILRTGWSLRRFCDLVLGYQGSQEPLYMSSRYRGQPVTAADLARVITAILQQIDCGAEVWGTYQYTGLEETTLYDMGLSIVNELGAKKAPHLVDDVDQWMAMEPLNATLNCKKIRNTFGIKPQSWQEALPTELAQLHDQDEIAARREPAGS